MDEQSRPRRGVRRQPWRAGAAGDHQRPLPGPRSSRRRVPDLHAELDLDPELAIVSTSAGCIRTGRCGWLVDAVRELEDCAAVIMGPGLPSYMDELRGRADELGIAEQGPNRLRGPDSRRRSLCGRGRRRDHPLPQHQSQQLPRSAQQDLRVHRGGHPGGGQRLPSTSSGDRSTTEVGLTFDPDQPGALTERSGACWATPSGWRCWRANAAAAATQLNWEVESRRLLEIVSARGRLPSRRRLSA